MFVCLFCYLSLCGFFSADCSVGKVIRSPPRAPFSDLVNGLSVSAPTTPAAAAAAGSMASSSLTSVTTPSSSTTPTTTSNTPVEEKMRRKLRKKNFKGETPLHQAAIAGNKTRVKKFLKFGADPNTKDNAGNYIYMNVASLLLTL